MNFHYFPGTGLRLRRGLCDDDSCTPSFSVGLDSCIGDRACSWGFDVQFESDSNGNPDEGSDANSTPDLQAVMPNFAGQSMPFSLPQCWSSS